MVDSTKNGCRKEPEGSDDLTFSQHIVSPVDCEKNITTSLNKKKREESPEQQLFIGLTGAMRL